EPEALGSGFLAHGVDAGDVAAGPVEAGDEAERDRVAAGAEDDRDGGGRGLGGKRRFRNAGADDNCNAAADQIGCQARQALRFIIRPPIFDLYVATFKETGFVKPLAECCHQRGARLRRSRIEIADHMNGRLLRGGGGWPCWRRAAEQRDEIAPRHSITSSARASRLSGTVRPSAFAVLRLIASSYLVGACTGRSAGFSPLRMRST